MSFNKEPAVWIGLIGAVILAVAQTISGSGILTGSTSNQLLSIVITLTPLITGILTRQLVSPVAK